MISKYYGIWGHELIFSFVKRLIIPVVILVRLVRAVLKCTHQQWQGSEAVADLGI
jgi:hypothetical protein